MKLLSNIFFTIAIILCFLALTLSFIIIQFVIHRGFVIDQNNVNIFDLLLKASFVLIGSSLSGFVAFLIFFLGDRKKEKEKAENEQKLVLKIRDEAANNAKIYTQMLSMFTDISTEQITELLHQDKSKIKEALLIYYTRLDFSLIQSSLKDISESSYIANITTWRKQKVIYDYLDLLLTNIHNEENTKMLLDLIKNEIIRLGK